MAATRARTEHAAAAAAAAAAASPASHNVDDMTSNSEAVSVNATTHDHTPARRTTTRTRKLPSRLMPSPSPPPSRPSSLFNAAKHAKGGSDGTNVPPTPPALASTASAIVSKSRKSARPDADITTSTTTDLGAAADKDDAEDLGPGKRKRRPSSMYRPPSTLTTVETLSPASSLSSSKSKKKGRSTSPEALASKGQSPSAAVAQVKLKNRLSKNRLESGTPMSKKRDQASSGAQDDAPVPSLRANGDDSDADLEAGACTESKRIRIADAQDSMDLSPPPLLPRDGSARMQLPMQYSQPTFIRGGRISVSPEASTKRPLKFGIRDFHRPHMADDALELERPRITNVKRANKREAQPSWKRSGTVMSSSPISAGLSKFESDVGAPLTYAPLRCGSRTAASFRNLYSAPLTRRVAEEEENSSDNEDEDDDENDFHQAMLDADFDFFDSQTSDSTSPKSLWPASRRRTIDEAEMDDTPATTPRSPLSGCDLPSPDSPRCKTKTDEDVTMSSVEDKVMSFSAGRDSVFAHALPTTQVGADKPHQHAGSLTLSLPYDPAVASSSPHLRAADLDSGAASVTKADKGATASTQMGTPVLQRRKHAGLPAGPHALAPLKLGADLMERSNSNALAYMQLSPMIEMESPLLSPGLTLSMHTKLADLPSPFLMGVSALPDLEQPAPLDLPPTEGSTTPKHSSPEISAAEPSSIDVAQSALATAKPEVVQETSSSQQSQVKGPDAAKENTVRVEKPTARRPALPPPRQIRFTTFTTASVESNDSKPQQPETTIKMAACLIPSQQQQNRQEQQAGAGAGASTSSISDPTPELIQCGSGSCESDSDSSSPMSQSDSASTADAEVETILFGPPEKLDLHELDHAWNGGKPGQHEDALRRATADQIRHVHVNAE